MSIDATNLSPFLQAAADSSASPAEDNAEAARQMEEQFLRMMMKELRRAIPTGGLLKGSVAVYDDIFDEQLAKSLADSGGIGIGERLASALDRDNSQANVETHRVFHGTARQAPRSFVQPTARPERFDSTHLTFPGSETQRPLADGVVTSHFGLRNDPFTGHLKSHQGLDIAAPEGSAFFPLAEGTVTDAGPRGAYGNRVVVDHGDGWTSSYAHCADLAVSVGDTVSLDTVLGTVGQTGRSTGPHLHLELRHDGQALDPHDALGWTQENEKETLLSKVTAQRSEGIE